MELPIIELTIENLIDGVDAFALVENPAIQKNFFAFNEQEDESKKFQFSVIDEEKRILAGAFMVADFPMYRNMEGKQFYAKFTKETIAKIVDKVSQNSKFHSFNIEHDPNKKVKDCYIQQHFIIDKANGVNAPSYYPELNDGSWFGFIKVNNDDVWEKAKSGEINGISIEGMFSEKEIKLNKNYMSKKAMEVLQIVKKFLFEAQEEKVHTLADGQTIKTKGDLAYDSEDVLLVQGEYTLEDGSILMVGEGGAVIEKVEPAPPADPPSGDPKAGDPPPADPDPMKFKINTIEEAQSYFRKFEEEGTPSVDITKLTEIVKFMFKDRFRWEIEEQERQGKLQEAMNVFQGFSTQIEALKDNQKVFLEALELSMIEKDQTRQTFSNQTADNKVSWLSQRVEARRKNQKVN